MRRLRPRHCTYPVHQPSVPPRDIPSFQLQRLLPLGRATAPPLPLLFAEVSSRIFSLIGEFYRSAAGTAIRTAAVIAYQPFGDLLRANSHWHALILEGGFDPEGQFFFLPIHDTQKLTECFRRAVIKLFLSKTLISVDFASTLLCWKNSGFSVDNSVKLNGDDRKARVALAQYIARAPLSLEKLVYDPESGKIFYHSTFNPYLGEKVKAWDVREFIALATQFVPPQGVRLIRCFGLYSSRSLRCSCPP